MKTSAAVLLTAFAALPLAACGGSQETVNTVVTDNVIDDGNDFAAADAGLDNAATGNDLLATDGYDNATVAAGNDLTAIDNSR